MARTLKTAAGRARTCGGFVLALLLVWPLGGSRAEGARFSLRLGEKGGVLSLGADRLLAWNERGQLQAIHPDGTWGPVFRVTAAGQREGSLSVGDAVGLNGRAVLLAAYVAGAGLSPLHTAAFEVDDRGNVRQLSNLPQTLPFVAVSAWDGRAWLQDLDGGIRELLSDGELGQRLSGATRPVGMEAPHTLVGGAAHSPVFYVSPDVSKATGHSAYCYSSGRNPWRIADGCAVAPTICGDYLVTLGDDRRTIVLRGLVDGRALAQRKTDRDPLVVCDGDDGVLVGGQTVTGLSLPELTRRWATRLKRGRARAVARVSGKVLVLTDEDAAVWLPARFAGPAR